jgi:hypothetical protein
MSPLTEEVFEFLIKRLASISPTASQAELVASRSAHLYLPEAVLQFWSPRGFPTGELSDEHWIPFYDAAWELARIGVLRPGRVAPKNTETANDFGDHWTITAFGFDWLSQTSTRPFIDMGRMSEVLAGFVPRLGPGFGQRAVEAVRTYRTANYLSSCTMAGAAAESILLAVAVAKSHDEARYSRCMPAPAVENGSPITWLDRQPVPLNASLKSRCKCSITGATMLRMGRRPRFKKWRPTLRLASCCGSHSSHPIIGLI